MMGHCVLYKHTVMLCQVVCLREKGRVLTRKELGEPVCGVLEVRDFGPDPKGRPQRYMRVAYLWTDVPNAAARCQAMRPLFEPRIVSLENGVLLLEGISLWLEHSSGPLHEGAQVWQCTLHPGAR